MPSQPIKMDKHTWVIMNIKPILITIIAKEDIVSMNDLATWAPI